MSVAPQEINMYQHKSNSMSPNGRLPKIKKTDDGVVEVVQFNLSSIPDISDYISSQFVNSKPYPNAHMLLQQPKQPAFG